MTRRNSLKYVVTQVPQGWIAHCAKWRATAQGDSAIEALTNCATLVYWLVATEDAPEELKERYLINFAGLAYSEPKDYKPMPPVKGGTFIRP